MAGLYENYRWGNYSWLVCAFGMAFFAWYFSAFSFVFLTMIGLFLLHSASLFLFLNLKKNI
jgi:hypothetical protein